MKHLLIIAFFPLLCHAQEDTLVNSGYAGSRCFSVGLLGKYRETLIDFPEV